MFSSIIEKIKSSKVAKAGLVALSLSVIALTSVASATVHTAPTAGLASKAISSVVALVTVPDANAAAVYSSTGGTITMPQTDVDALGEQSVNATLSIFAVLMQFGKYFIILAAIYGIVRFVKGFIGGR